MTDRRAGKRNVPHVGRQPRSRNHDGTWRRKRDDAGKTRESSGDGLSPGQIVGIVVGILLAAYAVSKVSR
jgi:hypothetical protein